MAVAYDASSKSHAAEPISVNEASFTWDHTPAGTPRSVLVFVFAEGNTEHSTAVTYGGVALTAVPGGHARDTSIETMQTTIWHLGASIPTGVQAVVVTRTNDANGMMAVAVTSTAGANCAVGTPVLQQENQVLAEANVDDGSPGSNSVRYGGVNSGLASHPTAGANSTLIQFIDGLSQSRAVVRETTAGQGSRPVGFTAATDDVAAVLVAVTELAPTGAPGNNGKKGLPPGQVGKAWNSGWRRY